ncbi:hypothetical protein FA95DRAFT_1613976 [Auriscalpium vulgare]|nr:hypothetical protein FA95DRAFT_1613976 [Auriscalpium vulgare]
MPVSSSGPASPRILRLLKDQEQTHGPNSHEDLKALLDCWKCADKPIQEISIDIRDGGSPGQADSESMIECLDRTNPCNLKILCFRTRTQRHNLNLEHILQSRLGLLQSSWLDRAKNLTKLILNNCKFIWSDIDELLRTVAQLSELTELELDFGGMPLVLTRATESPVIGKNITNLTLRGAVASVIAVLNRLSPSPKAYQLLDFDCRDHSDPTPLFKEICHKPSDLISGGNQAVFQLGRIIYRHFPGFSLIEYAVQRELPKSELVIRAGYTSSKMQQLLADECIPLLPFNKVERMTISSPGKLDMTISSPGKLDTFFHWKNSLHRSQHLILEGYSAEHFLAAIADMDPVESAVWFLLESIHFNSCTLSSDKSFEGFRILDEPSREGWITFDPSCTLINPWKKWIISRYTGVVTSKQLRRIRE